MNENIRKRIERQTPWRKGEIGVKITHLYTTVFDLDYIPQKRGSALVISEKSLTRVECLGFAALLYDYVPIEFDTQDLIDAFERNELAAEKKGKTYEGRA